VREHRQRALLVRANKLFFFALPEMRLRFK
jgi:hypothetical protein